MKSLLSIPKLFLSVCAAVMLLIGAADIAAAGVDNNLYTRLTDQCISEGVVDHNEFKSVGADLDRYLALSAAVDPGALIPADRFAFSYLDYDGSLNGRQVRAGHRRVRLL